MKINNSSYNYTGLNKNIKNNPTKSKNVAFGGLYGEALEKAAGPISNAMLWLGTKKPVKSMIKTFAHSPQGYTHMMTLESIVIGGFYMQNTARNKKIEKKQKLPLMINDGLVTLVSAILNYTLDDKISTKINQLKDSLKTNSMKNATKEMFKEASEILNEKQLTQVCAKLNPFDLNAGEKGVAKTLAEVLDADTVKKVMKTITPEKIVKASESTMDVKKMNDILDGIGKFKGLVIFSLIYRYLSPVLITPIANKISGKIQHHVKKNKAEATPAANKTTEKLATK